MDVEVVLDADVVIKCSCFDLLAPTSEAAGGPSSTAILGVTKFVVRRHLSKAASVADSAGAARRFDQFLDLSVELEPTDEEIRIALLLEEAALEGDAQLDTGESLIIAILIVRGIPRLVTGDKRAIRAVERLLPRVASVAALRARIASLEQLILALLQRLEPSVVRSRVCAERNVDTALTICFSCHAPTGNPESWTDGLRSYIASIRSDAPTVLCADVELF